MEKPEGVSLRDPAPMSIGGAGSFGTTEWLISLREAYALLSYTEIVDKVPKSVIARSVATKQS
ncbi:MAG: hypothetical protein QME51_07600, partial [Planctomycetota bacterium]|nr:hypothetical protein [Planctomycetota bacterium]